MMIKQYFLKLGLTVFLLAKKDLNYLPGYDLKGGLKETLEWYKINKCRYCEKKL